MKNDESRSKRGLCRSSGALYTLENMQSRFAMPIYMLTKALNTLTKHMNIFTMHRNRSAKSNYMLTMPVNMLAL